MIYCSVSDNFLSFFLQSILDVAKGVVSECNFCTVCEVLCTMQTMTSNVVLAMAT